MEDVISKHSIIGIDTMVFIYKFVRDERYISVVDIILNALVNNKVSGLSSVITYLEILSFPPVYNNTVLVNQYKEAFRSLDNFKFIHTNNDILEESIYLCAYYNLKIPDSLEIATAKVGGCSIFITNDKVLKRVNDYIDIILLEDYV